MNRLVCPSCEKYYILDPDTACTLAKKRVEYANKLWDKEIELFEKQDILKNIVWERDKESSKLDNLAIFDVGIITRQTMLLKRIIKSKGGTRKPNSITKHYEKISDLNHRIFGMEEDESLIKSDLAIILCVEKLDVEQPPGLWLFSKLFICEKEQYVDFIEYYDKKYNLMSSHKVDKKFLVLQDEINQLLQNPTKTDSIITQEFVSTYYNVISNICMALSRNEMFYNIFNLKPYKEIMNNPSDIIKLVNRFEKKPEQITHCTKTEFLAQAKDLFRNIKIKKLEEILIFSETNQDIFPLFVAFQKNGIECVLIPHEFAKLIYIQLHIIFAKKLFDKETEKYGKQLEKDIKENFKKAGFRYEPNVKDKKKSTLEIDGIAIKGNHCFVIESKVKSITKLMEEKHIVSKVITDLQGIVDGIETSQNKNKSKRIPSLLKKIEYVKKCVPSTYIKDTNNLTITGVIVTTIYPWIQEYKGVKIITYEELSSKLTDDKILELET